MFALSLSSVGPGCWKATSFQTLWLNNQMMIDGDRQETWNFSSCMVPKNLWNQEVWRFQVVQWCSNQYLLLISYSNLCWTYPCWGTPHSWIPAQEVSVSWLTWCLTCLSPVNQVRLSADNPRLCNSILSPTITSSCLLISLSSSFSSSSPLISIALFHTQIISSLLFFFFFYFFSAK